MPDDQGSAMKKDELEQKPDLGRIAFSLAVSIARLGPGPAAALRRGPLVGAGAAAFWQLLAENEVSPKDWEEQAWASLIQAIAILTPKGSKSDKQSAHQPKIPMGSVLQEAGISELRLARLLNTPRKMRGDAAVRLCRRLVAQNNFRFDLRTLAYFILSGGDKTSRRIAREYYGAEARTSHKEKKSA